VVDKRRVDGKVFQTVGPETAKLQLVRLVLANLNNIRTKPELQNYIKCHSCTQTSFTAHTVIGKDVARMLSQANTV